MIVTVERVALSSLTQGISIMILMTMGERQLGV